MCGIVGWIDWQENLSDKAEILASMTQTLTNRGPDASGVWLSPQAAFGHRRLIVIDPEGGTQPMLREAGSSRFILTYNGELYNTTELRRELQTLGHYFRSHSDTEVLLISYIQWGPRCVEKLNGIYAFAVWDEEKELLFLARDRMGVKPLFYTQRGNSLLFASELKALLAHPSVEPEIDAEGLAEIFIVGPARTPGHGIFKNIRELKPGHCLYYSKSGLKISPYWSLKSEPHTHDEVTTITKVRALVEQAIGRQLIADVPICTLLSGGLDSSAISAFAANHYRENNFGILDTYSVDFADNNKYFKPNEFQPNSDSSWIPIISQFLGTNHHYINLDIPEQIETLPEGLLARDLPGMADIDTSLYLFCREIKKTATVALSGECADEIFGGYPWFSNKEAIEANTFPWSLKAKERVKILSPDLIDYIKPESYLQKGYEEALAEVPILPGERGIDKRMREIYYLNITRFMTTLLDRKDRMSMAVGLEVRVPFCDHELVEYVWNIPWKMKRYNNMEKGILRAALSDLLPEGVLNRKKSPYPKTHNPLLLKKMQEMMLETLNDKNSPIIPLIDKDFVTNIAKGQETNYGPSWFGQLMGLPQLFAYLIQVDTWLRKYKITIK